MGTMMAGPNQIWQQRAGLLLLAGMVFKLVVAWSFPLGVDEAYAVAVARDFSCHSMTILRSGFGCRWPRHRYLVKVPWPTVFRLCCAGLEQARSCI